MDTGFFPYCNAGIIPPDTTERRRSKCGSFVSSSKRISLKNSSLPNLSMLEKKLKGLIVPDYSKSIKKE